MPILARITLAFALSLAAGGAVQQAIMIADHANEPLGALLPFGVIVLLITAVFCVVIWRRRTARAVGRAAVAMLACMLVFGLAVYVMGANSLAPGVGGNIVYLIALLVDFYFLIPAAVAVPIHWLLLRSTAEPCMIGQE
jgi:hypothetical protein